MVTSHTFPTLRSADLQSFSNNRLFTQLPENGTYTVIATRPDGESGADVGEFMLSVDTVPVIEIGASVTDTISSEENAHYYAYSRSEEHTSELQSRENS